MEIRVLWEVVSACVGTMAFALLFFVPKKYLAACGLIGGCGWLVYRVADQWLSTPFAVFAGTIAVVLLARYFGAWMKCPVTLFLISGIFPLVPGSGIYWTAYYMVQNEMNLASEQGNATLKSAIAIAFGILVIFELPQKFFRVRKAIG